MQERARCLEHAASQASPSLGEYVAKTRLHAPAWLAWVTVSLFCSLHLIVPTLLATIVATYLMCFRGKHILDTVEWLSGILIPSEISSMVTF